VSPTIHDFWTVKDRQQREQEMINFMKNMALLGAAIALAGVEEPWPASLSRKRPSTIERIRSLGKRKLAA
jgi:hypothetical protein